MLPRVLHLRTVSGRGGGPEKTLLHSPRFLAGSYELRLAYIRPVDDPEYDMPQRARELGVDLVDLPEKGGFDPGTVSRLARVIRDFRPDILHAHDYKTNILGIWLGRRFRVPVMTTAHGYVTLGGRLRWYYWADRWALRRMDHVIAVSPDLFDHLTTIGVAQTKCSLIYNGIDTEMFRRRKSPPDAKAELGFQPDRLLVGAVGRLQPEKGFDVLIEAAGRLLREGHEFDLVIAGDGPERGHLDQLIRKLGCQEQLRLLGHRTDVSSLYEAFDIFALSSLREGLPNVLLEAMAQETPVIATRVGGVPDLIRSPIDGLLVEPGSADALATALSRLLTDANLRQTLAEAGRARVVNDFSFAVRMQKVKAIYDRLLNDSAREAPVAMGGLIG